MATSGSISYTYTDTGRGYGPSIPPDELPIASMAFKILDPVQRRAPTCLTVTLSGGWENGPVQFWVDLEDGDPIYTVIADDNGVIDAISIPVEHDTAAGTHLMIAKSSNPEPDDGDGTGGGGGPPSNPAGGPTWDTATPFTLGGPASDPTLLSDLDSGASWGAYWSFVVAAGETPDVTFNCTASDSDDPIGNIQLGLLRGGSDFGSATPVVFGDHSTGVIAATLHDGALYHLVLFLEAGDATTTRNYVVRNTTTGTIPGGGTGGGDTVRYDSDQFTLQVLPTVDVVMGPDADPVEVPGALNDDGSRNWVFQDLMPGGLDSYVFPRNPRSFTTPVTFRDLASHHTTSVDGQHHITEAHDQTTDFEFAGQAFTEDEQRALEDYWNLDRRFYLIDHENRAWTVALAQITFDHKLRTRYSFPGQSDVYSDWVAEYTATAHVYGTPRTPVPL